MGVGAGAGGGRGRGRGTARGGRRWRTRRPALEGEAATARRSVESEKEKPDNCYVRVLCRVPVIWHSTKIFFIFKIRFAECQIGDTRQRLIALRCRVSPNRHSAKHTLPSVNQLTLGKLHLYFFVHQTFYGLFLRYVDLHVPFGDNYNCVFNI
jgi:hypothetical protein